MHGQRQYMPGMDGELIDVSTELGRDDTDEGAEFGVVVAVLKIGARARRASWPDGWWLVLVPGSVCEVQRHRPLGVALPAWVGEHVNYCAHLDLIKPHGEVSTWAPTHADLLAVDWAWVAGQPDAVESELDEPDQAHP